MKSCVQVDHRKLSESSQVSNADRDPLYSGSRLKDHRFRSGSGLRCITVMTYASMYVGWWEAVDEDECGGGCLAYIGGAVVNVKLEGDWLPR